MRRVRLALTLTALLLTTAFVASPPKSDAATMFNESCLFDCEAVYGWCATTYLPCGNAYAECCYACLEPVPTWGDGVGAPAPPP